MEMTLIEAREAEIAQYAANIAMYEAIAASLPSEWPAHLESLKDSQARHEDIGKISDMADVELVGDLWTHDDALKSIRAETVEMRKAAAILAALKA